MPLLHRGVASQWHGPGETGLHTRGLVGGELLKPTMGDLLEGLVDGQP